jgi:hypothetical protein
MDNRQDDRAAKVALEMEQDEGAVLAWTCHKANRNPLLTVAVSALILAFGIIVFHATERSAVFAGLTLVILFLSLSRFYLPIRYRLTDRRIMIKTMTQTLYKDWSVYRTCYPDKNGILLSPFIQPSRLENFRGIYLLFNDNAQQVTEFVKARIGRPATGPIQAPKESE